MILAAGLGTRMAPLSPGIPKPALPVLDRPLALRLIDSLAEHGVEAVIVNAHTQPERLRASLRGAPIPVEISYEPSLLGSGGGIREARKFLTLDSSEPCLVLNADMCVAIDIGALLAAHRSSGALVTLMLRDEPRKAEFGSIGISNDAKVVRITDRVRIQTEDRSGLFTGVQVIEPALFSQMPQRAEFGIVNDVYVPLVAQGESLGAYFQPSNQRWWPVGTPRELLDANLSALAEEAPGLDGQLVHPEAHVEGELRGRVWIGKGARIGPGAVAGPDAVIGQAAVLKPGLSASESLLLPGAQPPGGDPIERAIAYDREIWRDA